MPVEAGPHGRPLTVAVAVAAVCAVVVLALIPFVAAVSEALSPGSIPQLAAPPGQPEASATVRFVVVAVRAALIVVPLLLAVRTWRGRGSPGLVAVLVLGALLDLVRGATAGPFTVPAQLLAAGLLLAPSARAWSHHRS